VVERELAARAGLLPAALGQPEGPDRDPGRRLGVAARLRFGTVLSSRWKLMCAGPGPAATVSGMQRAGMTTTPEPVPVR
jgi:hypothetical protein